MSLLLLFGGGVDATVTLTGLAAVSVTGTLLPIAPVAGELSLVVAGVTRAPRVNTLTYTDELNTRNTLSCEFWDPVETFHPSCGQEVILYDVDGVTVLFAGTLDHVEEFSIRGVTAGYGVRVTAVDYSQIPDRKLVAVMYEDQAFAAIVADLVTSYLASDGVAMGTVDAGPVLPRKVFNYRSVSECFNELSEDTGYAWWIDSNRALQFRARETIQAPLTVTLTNATVRTINVRNSRAMYRNRQFIRAGHGLTDPATESFTGDDTRQTFSVAFPIGEEPTITVNAASQTVGIRGVEDAASFQWFWNKDSTEISQRLTDTPLAATDVLAVTYRGRYPLLVQAQDDAQIASRVSLEGGSGLYESIDHLPDIDDSALAFSAAVARLQQNGLITQTVEFETDQAGLRAGQLIPIQLTAHAIDEDFLIQSVRARDVQGQFLRYVVTAIGGGTVGGWIDFYQRLIVRRREAVQTDSELLLLARTFSDVAMADESLTSDTGYAKETRIGFAQIGRSEIGAM